MYKQDYSRFNKKNSLNQQELLLIVVLTVVLGIVWMIYGWLFSLIEPILKPLNLNAIFQGIWVVGGGFVAIIVRKKYSALLGEFLPSCVEMLASSWGVYNLIYGLLQGITSEAVFLLVGYKKAGFKTMIVANICSNIVGFFISYIIYHYDKLSFNYNLLKFILEIISTICFTILFFKITQLLNKLGYTS